MTKIRTVIPSNAKPGQSIIQVTHPKTGKPTRILVPKNAIPGEMIELQLPDEPSVSRSPGRVSPANPSSRRGSKSSETEKRTPRQGFLPYNSSVSPPPQLSLVDQSEHPSSTPAPVRPKQETEPLINKGSEKSKHESSSLCSCFSSLCCLSG
jgi:hypothetical protein